MDWTPYRIERLERVFKANAETARELQALIHELSDQSGAKRFLIEANEHLAQVENAILEVQGMSELARDLSGMLNQLAMDEDRISGLAGVDVSELPA